MSESPQMDSLDSIWGVAYDVGEILGSTNKQGMQRALRLVNRAAIEIAGHDKRWSWLRGYDTFQTICDQFTYSLPTYVKKEHLMWMEGRSRQKLDRIPERRFRELAPNPKLAKGIPRLYGFEGVDSEGAIMIFLYPVPNLVLTIHFDFAKRIVPAPSPNIAFTQWWGMPNQMREILVKKAASIGLEAVDDERAPTWKQDVEAMIQEAYASDQSHPDTTYRAPMNEVDDMLSDGPMLPASYGGGGPY